MQWPDYEGTFLLITSTKKDTPSLKNNLCRIALTLPILGIHRPIIPFGNSLFVVLTNYTCVKSSISSQYYKVVTNYAHEILVRKILSRLLHAQAPHLGGISVDAESNIATLAFKNGEQLDDFHIIIIRLQHEVNLAG